MNAATKPSDAKRSEEAAEAASTTAVPAAPGAVPLGKRGAIYTMTAREGLDAAEIVNAAFARKTIGKQTPRRLEVVAPDGPSTVGGKRARQTIRLVPATGGGAPVMCGFLDVSRKLVELRSYASVVQSYEERFGANFDVSAVEYGALCKDLEATLSVFRYEFHHDAEAPASPVHSARATPKVNAKLLNWVLVGLTLLVAGVAIAIAML